MEKEETDLLHGDLDIEMSEKVETITSFDDLGLKESLLKGMSYIVFILFRSLCIRLRQTISSTTEGYLTNY